MQFYAYILVLFQKACRRLHRYPRPLLNPLQSRQQVRESSTCCIFAPSLMPSLPLHSYVSGLTSIGITVTSIVITYANQCLDLAEVWLYSQGTQVQSSSLSFSLSSIGYFCGSTGIPSGGSLACLPSYCNDGDLNTICHGGCTAADTLTIQASGPMHASPNPHPLFVPCTDTNPCPNPDPPVLY